MTYSRARPLLVVSRSLDGVHLVLTSGHKYTIFCIQLGISIVTRFWYIF